jgi:hypothetical protein
MSHEHSPGVHRHHLWRHRGHYWQCPGCLVAIPLSIYFDVMGNNERIATVSIRRLCTPSNNVQVFGYEIASMKTKLDRGAIEHTDVEDLALINAVLTDYLQKGGSNDPIEHEPRRPQ